MALFPTRQIFAQIGPIAVHWYGIMYLAAFLLAWRLLPLLARKKGIPLSEEQTGNLLFAGILGVLIGGRLGYVVFYGAQYYGEHPLEILAVWKGGMSSHGGFIGVAIALLLTLRALNRNRQQTLQYTSILKYQHLDVWRLADIIVVPAAIGLALGRFGNFINQELYGPVTALPWGWAIPGVEGLRHPTPIYAVLKNTMIAGICFTHLMKSSRPGSTAGVFLLLYGVLRFLIEYVRVETASGFDIGMLHVTRGQALTVPIALIGVWILYTTYTRRA